MGPTNSVPSPYVHPLTLGEKLPLKASFAAQCSWPLCAVKMVKLALEPTNKSTWRTALEEQTQTKTKSKGNQTSQGGTCVHRDRANVPVVLCFGNMDILKHVKSAMIFENWTSDLLFLLKNGSSHFQVARGGVSKENQRVCTWESGFLWGLSFLGAQV